MNARILPLALAALITISACGSSDTDDVAIVADDVAATTAAGATDASNEGATVMIDRSRFDNTELRVAVGTTVTFVNNDAFAHTITSRDDASIQFDSGEFGQDETFEFTFEEAGEFAYFCRIHPTMRAVVIVE